MDSSKKEAITLNQDQDTNTNERNSAKESGESVPNQLRQEVEEVPLFQRDSSEGKKGDAQDEKDNAEE